jgi:uncharacterized protein
MPRIPVAGLAPFVAALCLSFALPACAESPPIDCDHAKTAVEKQICSSPADVALDREIAALYDRGLAEFSPDQRHALVESQRRFLHARAGCAWAMHSAHPGAALSECLHNTMGARLHALRRAVDSVANAQ